MPVKSQSQFRYLAIHDPGVLHDWQKEAPVTFKNLPKHVKKKKGKK